MTYIAVGIGGVVGALLRYGLALAMKHAPSGIFPLATLLTNLIGSFFLAFLTMYLFRMGRLHPRTATAIGTGVIGAFTTFSTFSVETMRLLQAGKIGMAALYVAGSAAGGLLAAGIGFRSGDAFYQRSRGDGAA